MDKTQKKLNYCKETKNLICQAIIDMGVDVPNDIPFEEYPGYIRGIGGSGVFTFSGLRRALTNGNAREKYPIGTEIPDKWTDTAAGKTYDMPMIVVHYGDVKLADGTILEGVYLMRKFATPFLVQFDAIDSRIGDGASGYNRYSQSGVHKWLNSSSDKTKWWVASATGDASPDIANTKDGYLKGCSEELLKNMADILVNCSTNTSTDGGVTDEIQCKFFLPSAENVHFALGSAHTASVGVEGGIWEYFETEAAASNTARSIRVIKDPNLVAQQCWLRSASRVAYNCALCIQTDGGWSVYNQAYTPYACAPCCVIV